MADYDLFDLTDLPFDPPEKKPRKVKDEIEKKLKELNAELSNESQSLQRTELNKKISFLKTCLGEEQDGQSIFASDGKLNNYYIKLAENRTRGEISNLKIVVNFMKSAGSLTITNGTILSQRKKTKLSKENIEKVYQVAGFNISTIDPNKAYPKFPTNAEKTAQELAALRKMKDPNPKGLDLSQCFDLYSFIAYLKSNAGTLEKPKKYREKSTTELKNILDHHSRELSQRNDELGKCLASIASSGKSYVFNSDENREKYDKFLLYQSSEMQEICIGLQGIPDAQKYESSLAEKIIKQIMAAFGKYGKYEVALAIYNKEANIKNQPYIPEKAVFPIRCTHCQNWSEFSDVNSAKEINKCSHCNNNLYKLCNKCSELVLVNLEQCSECGFVFASAEMFGKFFSSAELALRNSDFDQARHYLLQAESANPSEKNRIVGLKKQIADAESKYRKPIQELRQLIINRKFCEASEILAKTIKQFPDLNVSEFNIQITDALNNAKKAFMRTEQLNNVTMKANACLAILQDCIDYHPAIDYLQTTPPDSCQNLSVIIDSIESKANLGWSRSAQQGITYRVVRKKGNKIPCHEGDGEILIDRTTKTTYCDNDIEPKICYSYAVFAIRFGVFSPAVGKSVVLLADVTNVYCEQQETTIYLTWDTPKNSTGISIERTTVEGRVILAKNVNGSYEDKDIQYGKSYTYKLRANYEGMPSSNGIEKTVTPTIQVDSFTIYSEHITGNKYRISWDIRSKDINLQLLIDEKPCRTLTSSADHYDLTLPNEGFHTVVMLAFSGGNWVRSTNSLQFSSPCSIDRTDSCLEEKTDGNIELHVKLTPPMFNNVIGFFYAVRTRDAIQDKAPWVDKEEIGIAPDIHKIGLSSLQKKGEITYSMLAEDEDAYYISLFTIYNFDGVEIISNASKLKLGRPLKANLLWKVSEFRNQYYELTINISAGRPFLRIPSLVLCACNDGQHLLNYSDQNGKIIQKFPQVTLTKLDKAHNYTFKINVSMDLKGLKLFLFETDKIPNENYTLRWMSGFEGKVQVTSALEGITSWVRNIYK